MATVNAKPSGPSLRTYEGAPAKRINATAQLRRAVMSALLWEREFYEDGEDIATRIRRLVGEVSLEDAAAIAIEAREQMHLRHVPLLIVREMARRGGAIVGETLARVIQRADEIPEFVALYWLKTREPLSAQVKLGLAQAFRKFNEYQLAKYNRDRAIKLRDVMFMVHPTPQDEKQADVWRRLVADELAEPDTWETALSRGDDKLATWFRLLSENALGGLAFLRNLRNMQQVGVPVDAMRDYMGLADFSRVLPFRFIAAAQYCPALEPYLEAAMFRSVATMEKFPGKTILLVDCSGSMEAKLSEKSDMTRLDAATGVAILLREVCEHVEIVGFSARDTRFQASRKVRMFIGWNTVEWTVDPGKPGVALVPARHGFALHDAIVSSTARAGTETETGKQFCDARGYDRLIIITDEQSSQALSNPKGLGYVINVASAKNGVGYGKWTHIDGWSESVVRYIQAAEQLRD